MSYQSPAITAIQQTFTRITDVYYCTGTVQLNASQSVLFYRSNGESRFIDFANPSETDLKALVEACSPASFGRNQEDVLDENYRKAGKMDTADFSTQFSPWDSGVFKTVVETLLHNGASMSDVTLELYKLNVYGPGSFFKAHVDTPRSDKMFGSLVVVLPTPHTGGSLLLRHHGEEYTFDSPNAVSTSPTEVPRAAFAAFFSDVEHEVTKVTSGYRITLTYNLYHAASPSPSSGLSTGVTSQNEVQTMLTLKNALTSLLSAPGVLPEGGLLAFGLSYEYPFSYHSTLLSDIGKRLKGLDALLLHVCNELDLKASVKAIYFNPDRNDECGFVDRFVQFPEEEQIEYTILEYLCEEGDGVVIGYNPIFRRPVPRYGHKYFAEDNEEDDDDAWDERLGMYAPHYHDVRDTEVFPVVWAKSMEDKNEFKEKYMHYGNEATMSCVYGQVCLVAHVRPASERGSSSSTDA